jgi:hypothetical protein
VTWGPPGGTQIPSCKSTYTHPRQVRIRKARIQRTISHSTPQSRLEAVGYFLLKRKRACSSKKKERKIILNQTTRGDLRFYRLLYLRDDGREQLLRDGGVAGAGGMGSNNSSLQGRRRHGVHLDSCRFEHVDGQEKQSPSDEKVYRWTQTRKNLKTGSVLLSHGQAKSLQPLKYVPLSPNFSKRPNLRSARHRAQVLTVWQEKLRRLEISFRR